MNKSNILIQNFTIRANDLDATGRTSVPALIQLLENQRWAAFDNNGFARASFEKGVIRAQYLEIFEQTHYNEKLEIHLWLGRIGRTSMDFGHKVFSKTSGLLVGQAAVRIVALDADFHPQPLPYQVHEFLSPQECAEIPIIQFTSPKDCWSHRFQVRWSDMDFMQHVNEARYIEYIEDTRRVCTTTAGYATDKNRALLPIHRLAISYEDQARAGDELRVDTWVLNNDPNQYAFEMRREPDQTVMTRAWIQVHALPHQKERNGRS